MTDNKIDKTEGGPEWERQQAAKRMAAGVQAGDATEIEIAADRLGDAVVNAASSRLIKTLILTIQTEIKPEIVDLTTEVKAANRRTSTVYAWLETEFQTNAAWRDKYSSEIDRILTSVQDGTTRLGKIETEQARQGVIVDARPAQRLAEKQERLAWQETIERRIEALERDHHAHTERGDDG